MRGDVPLIDDTKVDCSNDALPVDDEACGQVSDSIDGVEVAA